MPVGTKIKEIRQKKQLTQRQLGELCGIADSNIRKYESGKQNPKLETLQKIATALNVSTSDLLEPETLGLANSVLEIFANNPPEKSEPAGPSTTQESFLISYFRELNERGQKKLCDYAEDLSKIPEYTSIINKEETFLNAAHDMGATPEQRRNADDIMQDDSEWDDIPAPKRATAPANRHEEELLAAHARTDVEPTPEGLQHDLDIMNDDSQWDD